MLIRIWMTWTPTRRTWTRVLALGVACALGAGPTRAQQPEFLPLELRTRTASRSELARTLAEKMQLEKQVNLVLPAILADLEQSRGTLDSDKYALLVSVLASTFQADRVYDRLLAGLERELPPDQLELAIEWYGSFVGRKITSLEIATFQSGQRKFVEAYMRQLALRPSSPHRATVVHRIDEVVRGTELAVEIASTTAIAVATAMDGILPEEQRLGEDRIRQHVLRSRPQFAEMYREQITSAYLYTYRDLVQPELQHYVTFLESETGRQIHDVFFGVYLAEMMEVAGALAAAFAITPPA